MRNIPVIHLLLIFPMLATAGTLKTFVSKIDSNSHSQSLPSKKKTRKTAEKECGFFCSMSQFLSLLNSPAAAQGYTPRQQYAYSRLSYNNSYSPAQSTYEEHNVASVDYQFYIEGQSLYGRSWQDFSAFGISTSILANQFYFAAAWTQFRETDYHFDNTSLSFGYSLPLGKVEVIPYVGLNILADNQQRYGVELGAKLWISRGSFWEIPLRLSAKDFLNQNNYVYELDLQSRFRFNENLYLAFGFNQQWLSKGTSSISLPYLAMGVSN